MDITKQILNNKQYKEQIDQLSDETLIKIANDHLKALEAAQKGIQQVEPEKVNDIEYLEVVAQAMEKLAKNVLYPVTLIPDHSETYLFNGISYTLPVVSLEFKKWEGKEILNTFGGKPLVDYEGFPVFAELAIQRTVIKGNWASRWIETYASKANTPYYFTDWTDVPLTQQVVAPLDDKYHEDLLKKIAFQNNNSYSGCWDVLAWTGKRTLFLESKRYKKDNVRDTQLQWLKSALEIGLRLDNFLIVQWDFIK